MSDNTTAAVLTPTQRELLRGEKEYTGEYAKQQRYARRQAIQSRVEASIEDFRLLHQAAKNNDPQTLPDIPIETWDALLSAVREVHPDPPVGDADTLRKLADELERKADRING